MSLTFRLYQYFTYTWNGHVRVVVFPQVVKLWQTDTASHSTHLLLHTIVNGSLCQRAWQVYY